MSPEMRHPVLRVEPGPGQESVWDYPRPPRVEPTSRHLVVEFGGLVVAETRRALRVLETSSPPVYYFPPEHVRLDLLALAAGTTDCEWKGVAGYFDLRVGEHVSALAAWSYARPSPGY